MDSRRDPATYRSVQRTLGLCLKVTDSLSSDTRQRPRLKAFFSVANERTILPEIGCEWLERRMTDRSPRQGVVAPKSTELVFQLIMPALNRRAADLGTGFQSGPGAKRAMSCDFNTP